MGFDISNAGVNIAVTILVIVMVVLMPWVDVRVAKKHGLNLQGGVSENPRADEILQLRSFVLLGVFGVYVAVVLYLVFFSRSAAMDYRVHASLFEDLRASVQIDLGILDLLRSFFVEGVPETLKHIHVISPYDLAQVYLNVMLFVPMGYLLPYVFRWFRDKVHARPTLACLLFSFLIENVQLVTKLGFYDVDDLVANTLGGYLGQMLYIAFAYVVTHPHWQREFRAYLHWLWLAHERTLYPFVHRVALPRTTILATSEEHIWDFYVTKLGFRLLKQTLPEDSNDTGVLLGLGKTEVEVLCSNDDDALPTQYLTISVKRLPPVKERLEKSGIAVSPVGQDPYNGHKSIWFEGPDGVHITLIER